MYTYIHERQKSINAWVHLLKHTFCREWKEKDGARKKQEAEMMNRLVDEQMQRMEAESEVTELKTALKKARSGSKGGDDTMAKELQALKAKCSEYYFYVGVVTCAYNNFAYEDSLNRHCEGIGHVFALMYVSIFHLIVDMQAHVIGLTLCLSMHTCYHLRPHWAHVHCYPVWPCVRRGTRA